MGRLAPYLTYLGALPFIFCAAAKVYGLDNVPWLGSVDQISLSYALVISTFLSGALWGQHLTYSGKLETALPIISNVIALFAWGAFLLFPAKILFFVYVLLFIVLLIIDVVLERFGKITLSYRNMRIGITGIVVLSLLICGVET